MNDLMGKQKEKISYENALKELEEIQLALEQNEVPVDELSEKVKRANFLLEYCQDMLHKTEEDVNKILNKEEK